MVPFHRARSAHSGLCSCRRLLRQIANISIAIRNARTKRDFLQAFADEPREFIQRWVAGQSRDLQLALGLEAPEGIVGTGLGKEDLRKSDTFLLPWVRYGRVLRRQAALNYLLMSRR